MVVNNQQIFIAGIRIMAGNTFNFTVRQPDDFGQLRNIPVTMPSAPGITIADPDGMAVATFIAIMGPDTGCQAQGTVIPGQGTIMAGQAGSR